MFAVIGRKTLLVKTFGEVIPKLVTCDIVQMCVHTRHGLAVYISCYSVPEISCQVITNKLSSNYQQVVK